MKILSVNVGKPKSYTLDGVTLETSMVKEPQTQIYVNKDNIEGDEFKGKNIHGTIDAVVYALDSRRYTFWSELCGRKLPLGFLGENLSIDKLSEKDFYLGDEFQCGGVVIRVTGVRYPCNRLNFVTGHTKMRDDFLNQDWPGIYFEVVKPGTIKPQDDLILKHRQQNEISALELYQSLRHAERKTLTDQQMERLAASPFLLEKYKDRLYRHSGRVKPGTT
jgi:MOSC domain-containing protein YiiM